MAEGKPAFKRSLAVDIEKPSDKEASELEDFPSPPPLYTPTTKELEDTLDKEMADNKPALGKSLSLSIDRPTDKEAEENEPPPVDPLPTPSQKEMESLFDEELKHGKTSPTDSSPSGKAEGYSGNGAETPLSKSQKKKAKKKAKKGTDGGAQSKEANESISEPQAYVPGSQWEPEDDDDDDMSKPAVPSASPVQAEAPPAKSPSPTKPDAPAPGPDQDPEPKAYVPGSKWEPDDDDDDVVAASKAEETADPHGKPPQVDVEASDTNASPVPPPPAAVPAAPATPASVGEPTPPVSKPKAGPSPSPKRTELRADTSFLKADSAPTPPTAPKPVPSKLSTEVISKFAAAASDAPAKPASLARAPSGGTKKWAPVPAPVLRKSLVGMDVAAAEKQAPTAVDQAEPDIPEPTGPVEYSKLVAGDPGSWPKGIKADQREKYLSDEEFEEVFQMSKDEFAKLKKWKKNDMKKAVKLF